MYKSKLKYNEILAPYTTWRVGGPADKYFRPQGLEELSEFLKQWPSYEPITWLGLGSNVLIHEDGIRGLVIHNLFSSTSAISDHEQLLRVEASIPCAKLAKYCANNGLINAEFFAGIPGTIGGALAMNAGAWGGETWSFVKKVEVMDRKGTILIRNADAYSVGYRKVAMPDDEWFVAAYFQFDKGDPLEATKKVKLLLKQRQRSQPIGVFSGGSVFKNPPNEYAGRLIEVSNLKGFRIGDAEVSEKHGNFIVNLGQATAQDIKQLIAHVQHVVLRQHNIKLETEVKLLGF